MTQGSPVIAGEINTATDVTTINSGTLVSYNLVGRSAGDGAGFFGGERGAYCVGQASFGVQAFSYQSDGVRAYGRRNGVQGVSSNPDASGVYGENSAAGWGTAGRTTSERRAGVLGDNLGSGPGVLGKSASGDRGPRRRRLGGLGHRQRQPRRRGAGAERCGNRRGGAGRRRDRGLCLGERAPLRLAPGVLPGAPTTGFHERGELMVDSGGDLYFCKASGTPGTWRLIG